MNDDLFHPQERVAIFIDGREFYHTLNFLGYDISSHYDLDAFRRQGRLLRAYYFTPMENSYEYHLLRPMSDWLAHNGYLVVTQQKELPTIHIAIKMLTTAAYYDHGVLFSGDADYCPVVARLQKLGKQITVVSTLLTTPAMLSDELRRQTDHVIELKEFLAVHDEK